MNNQETKKKKKENISFLLLKRSNTCHNHQARMKKEKDNIDFQPFCHIPISSEIRYLPEKSTKLLLNLEKNL